MPPKSGHQRAKNIDYDDEDVYSDEDYYEEEGGEGGDGMTDEDREQMRIGTTKVREALNSDLDVSDAQIQEALWHYFYDVGKSVTYLKNKYAPVKAKPATEPKKAKTVSRFDQAATAAETDLKSSIGKPTSPMFLHHTQAMSCTAPSPMPSLHSDKNHERKQASKAIPSKGCAETPLLYPIPASMKSATPSTADFFWDMPWGNVPSHRLGEITMEPLLPRGRLLGGSSKLAALAAAKKKRKEEGAKNGADVGSNGREVQSEVDSAISILDRLSVKGKESPAISPSLQGGEIDQRPGQGRYLLRKRPRSPQREMSQPEEPPSEEPAEPVIQFPDLRTSPSTFASTLCGLGAPSLKRQRTNSSFPAPYAGLPGFSGTNPFAGPSPDDVVLRAQAKGTKAKPSQKKQIAEKLAESVDKLTVEETPKVKSKNLNVVEEFEKSGMKRMANFVVIGHVDHGKSTLMGRLLYDLKVIDQRSIDKLRKEAETIGKSSFALAWVMDQTSEERSRGVTVDIATNYFETEKTRFTILDAPGHKDFIPNMIAGASQADFAVLVIDASTNSFESGLKGQTKEHALLVRSMGVQRLIVAVNKMDTVSWSQERFEDIQQQMTAFLTAASFLAKSITFVPCAGLTGENVTRKVQDPSAEWYTDETLIEALDASEPAKRNIEKPLRLTISDVFRGGITNPLSIAGRIDAGSVQVGDSILAMPSNETAVVKAIEVENESVDWAVAGQIPVLHLTDIDPIHLRLGDIICDPKKPVKPVKTFTCKILAFEHVLPSSVDVFRGRLQAEGKITQLVALLNKASGEITKKKPRIVKPAEVARVLVELEKELPLEVGTRVVLRESGNTIAAGLLEA